VLKSCQVAPLGGVYAIHLTPKAAGENLACSEQKNIASIPGKNLLFLARQFGDSPKNRRISFLSASCQVNCWHSLNALPQLSLARHRNNFDLPRSGTIFLTF
jgi:hypothetical protein